jgi:ubiquinone/menaquinone biosynthesis C-methylase UbiE
MGDPTLSAYECPARHAAVSEIIRSCSTNPVDVSETVLRGLDLSHARSVLDLGCGFGFLTDAIAERLRSDAVIVGVDACAANEGPYLKRVGESGRSVRFVHQRIDAQLDSPDRSFDLVIACYSLYFFVDVLPEVARVLVPGGVFLAVTHTEQSCRDLLRVAGLRGANSRLIEIVRRFSVENAERSLARWFAVVERVDYHNSLTFDPSQRDDLLAYLRFKLPFLSPEAHPGSDLPAPLGRSVRSALARQGRVVVAKDDAAFRCTRPRCH